MSEATKRLERQLSRVVASKTEIVRAARAVLYALNEKLDDEVLVEALNNLDEVTRVEP